MKHSFLSHNWPTLLTDAIFGDQWMIHAPMAPGVLLGLYEQSLASQGVNLKLEERPRLDVQFSALENGEDRYADLDEAPANVVAVIPLKGVMIKYSTWWIHGALEIAHYIREAAASDKVIAVVLDCDSGGGSVAAIAPITQAIEYVRSQGKPIVSSIDMSGSANYWMAAATDHIEANNNISATAGCIGTMWSFLDVIPYFEKEGIKYHEVYSNLSEEKNKIFRDALKGKYDGMKKEWLDPHAKAFQDFVRARRGSKLNQDIPGVLSGKMFNPQESLEAGLIDAIGDSNSGVKKALEIAHVNNFLKT